LDSTQRLHFYKRLERIYPQIENLNARNTLADAFGSREALAYQPLYA